MNHTQRLMAIAKKYVEHLDWPDKVCSFAGGSVGRGEADAYSDLDLNVYLEKAMESYSENIKFQGEIIQLHVHTFPPLDEVYEEPWNFRFTEEARTVSDPSGRFEKFQEEAIRFLKSKRGRTKMLEQAGQVVEIRKQWAKESLRTGNLYSAGMAGMATLTDAGLMNAYFLHGFLSSDGFVKVIRKTEPLFDKIKNALPISVDLLQQETDEIMKKVSDYLRHLRSVSDDPEDFPIAPVQEILLRRKIDRCKQFGDGLDLFFLLYGEVFWFWLSGSREETFEEHMQTLPGPIQENLRLFGFVERTPTEVDRLCALADQFVSITENNEES